MWATESVCPEKGINLSAFPTVPSLTLTDHIAHIAPSVALTVTTGTGTVGTSKLPIYDFDTKRPSFSAPSRVGTTTGLTLSRNGAHCNPTTKRPTLQRTVTAGLRASGNLYCNPRGIVIAGNNGRSLCKLVVTLVRPKSRIVVPTPC